MSELETLLLQKFTELSSYQERQSEALRRLVSLQSSRLDDLSAQVLRLAEQLNALSERHGGGQD